MWLPAARNLL
jgi:hypothetical protein